MNEKQMNDRTKRDRIEIEIMCKLQKELLDETADKPTKEADDQILNYYTGEFSQGFDKLLTKLMKVISENARRDVHKISARLAFLEYTAQALMSEPVGLIKKIMKSDRPVKMKHKAIFSIVKGFPEIAESLHKYIEEQQRIMNSMLHEVTQEHIDEKRGENGSKR